CRCLGGSCASSWSARCASSFITARVSGSAAPSASAGSASSRGVSLRRPDRRIIVRAAFAAMRSSHVRNDDSPRNASSPRSALTNASCAASAPRSGSPSMRVVRAYTSSRYRAISASRARLSPARAWTSSAASSLFGTSRRGAMTRFTGEWTPAGWPALKRPMPRRDGVAGGASRSGVSDRNVCPFRYLDAQILRRLEDRDRPGGYLHRIARAGVARHPRATLAHLEGTEPADLDVLVVRHRILDGVEQAVYHQCAILLGDPRADGLGYLLDEVGFRHLCPPLGVVVNPVRTAAAIRPASASPLKRHDILESGRSVSRTQRGELAQPAKRRPRKQHIHQRRSVLLPAQQRRLRAEPGHPAGNRYRVRQVADPVHEPQRGRLPPRDHTAIGNREHLLAREAPLLHHRLNKLAVHILDQGVEQHPVPLAHRAEGRADVLVLGTLHHLHLHTHLVHQLGRVRHFHDHADRAGKRAGQNQDRVCGQRYQVSARGANPPDRRDHRLAVLAQSPQLAIDALRRTDDAARRVDRDHVTLHTRVVAVLPELFEQLSVVGNDAVDLDQRDSVTQCQPVATPDRQDDASQDHERKDRNGENRQCRSPGHAPPRRKLVSPWISSTYSNVTGAPESRVLFAGRKRRRCYAISGYVASVPHASGQDVAPPLRHLSRCPSGAPSGRRTGRTGTASRAGQGRPPGGTGR